MLWGTKEFDIAGRPPDPILAGFGSIEEYKDLLNLLFVVVIFHLWFD